MKNLIGLKLDNIDELKKYNLIIDSTDKVYVHNTLKELMDSKGISQSDLAVLAGTNRQSICDLIQNTLMPRIDMALKIATVLGVSVEDLFKLTDDSWYRVLKVNYNTVYIDLYTLEINDSLNIKKEDGLDYIDIEKHECIDKTEFNNRLEEYIIERRLDNNTLNKKSIVSEFDKICTKRYKKLLTKVEPITL